MKIKAAGVIKTVHKTNNSGFNVGNSSNKGNSGFARQLTSSQTS